MTASQIANSTAQADECPCPPAASTGAPGTKIRSALDAVELTRLTERVARLRFPEPKNVIGAKVPEDACTSGPCNSGQ